MFHAVTKVHSCRGSESRNPILSPPPPIPSCIVTKNMKKYKAFAKLYATCTCGNNMDPQYITMVSF